MCISFDGQESKIEQRTGIGDAGGTRGLQAARPDGGAGVSSLDISSDNSPLISPPDKPKSCEIPLGLYAERRKNRLYWLLRGGFESARHHAEIVRFMTLTTADDSTEDIHASFEKFVKRVRRNFGRFEYACVREWDARFKPHLHILFRGSYMPQKWISETWAELHSSFIVDIREAPRANKAVYYLMKYLTKDGNRFDGYAVCSDGVMRDIREAKREIKQARRDGVALGWTSVQWHRAFWYSSGWIFKGSNKAWQLLVRAWFPLSGYYKDKKDGILSTEGCGISFKWVLDQWRRLIAGEYLRIGDRYFHVVDGKLEEFVDDGN